MGSFFDLNFASAGIKSFSIYQITTGTGDGIVLENFGFTAGTAVPEPASWALLIAGFGLTGAAMRRRRQAIVAA
nr:PEPxxWA-CTERM sorting domain-containing protein [Polymorphobacter glacialis]